MCELVGYYVSGNKSSRVSISKYHNNINKIIPTWLELKDDGRLLEKQNKQELMLLNNLKDKKFIIPLVQNYQMKSEVSNQIVCNNNIWDLLINNLDQFLVREGYQGLNLDLEGIRRTNRSKLLDFISRLSSFFHSNSYRFGFSIPAKTDDNGSAWSGAYEYEAIGELVDEIVIMAYDYHWASGPAGAIAPLPWVQDIIDYVIMKIPLKKVYLGVPFYGYDWIIGSDKSARGLSYYQAMSIKERFGGEIEWDQESQTPYMKYENEAGKHEVWFENRKSILKKLDLVKEFQLAGAAFWRMGLEDPELWPALD